MYPKIDLSGLLIIPIEKGSFSKNQKVKLRHTGKDAVSEINTLRMTVDQDSRNCQVYLTSLPSGFGKGASHFLTLF